MDIKPNITDFSHELLCHILDYLPLRKILSVAMLCKKMLTAVNMHLQLCKSIDFCEESVFGYMPSAITDDHLLTLLKKCPLLETVYGLHPIKIERRRLRKRAALTIPGIIEALSLCFHLKAIETSDLRLFEAIMQHLPQLEIIGHFQNRNGLFPPQASQRLKLQPYPRISSLHLIGVEVPELTAMPHLQHLHLQCVRFTKLQPFRAFLAQNLKSFIMKHCIGPSVPQRYLSLIIALSSSPNLKHLELIRVPLLNGLFQRAVEDSYRHNGFVNLRTLIISGCKGILEADLGHLMVVASKNLETLYIQPSLTKDSLFVSLSYAQCSFPVLQNLHLGYIDNLNSSSEWSNDALLSFGLAEVPDTPSSLTDSGMKVISLLFPYIKTLSVSNCPHLMLMYQWMSEEGPEAWSRLTDLTLQKCHCLQLSSFALFIAFLPTIEVVILNDMFREPPKGCSHVGLSAGTGLGMSSAVVSNQDEHIAVQGHHQEFEPPGDEENEEIEREFIDVENEDNPEHQFVVLQRDFFDGEDNGGGIDDPPLENAQDPAAREGQLNIVSNEVNNNRLPNENIVVPNENSILVESSVSSSSGTFTSGNQNCNMYEPKCHSKNIAQKNKLPKSLCIKNEIHNDEDDISKKESELSSMLIEYQKDEFDYDPHKPSTSKAGSHLDYSGDGDYKYNKGIKRINKYSDNQDLIKKQKKSIKITKDNVDEKVRKNHNISSRNNSFENHSNNHNDFRRNSNETPVSIRTNNISENMSCYVLVEKLKISEEIVSESDNENISRIKNNKDYVSKNVPCCNCHYGKNIKENTCTHVMFSEEYNDTYSEKKKSPIENGDKNLLFNADLIKYDSKAEATSFDYKSEINEAQINENVDNITSSESDHKNNIDSTVLTSFHFNEQLIKKKIDNDVYELSEHEILLNGSLNESNKKTIQKTEARAISPFEKTSVNTDMLHSATNESPSASIIKNEFHEKNENTGIKSHFIKKYNSVATQTYLNDYSNDDFDVKCNPPNENGSSLTPLKKSGENLGKNESSCKERTFKISRLDDSLETLDITKPCCVLIPKIENIHAHLGKYSDDNIRNVNKNPRETSAGHNFKQDSCNYLSTSNISEKSLKEEFLSEDLEICDPLQPSTSKARIDICHNSSGHSVNFKKMHTSKYFKRRKSSGSTRSKNLDSNIVKSSSENAINSCSSSLKTEENVENINHHNLTENNSELLSHDSKRLKKSEVNPDNDNYKEDKYYVSISNNDTLEIINSVTSESYQIPNCHVALSKINNEICNLKKASKCNDSNTIIKKSQKYFAKQYYDNEEFNPNLPSTSKAPNHLNNVSEKVPCSNDRCKIQRKKLRYVKYIKNKNLNEYCYNYSMSLNSNEEKMHIKKSDAVLLLKQAEKDSKCNACQISCQFNTEEVSRPENEVNFTQEQKFKNESNNTSLSENISQENDIAYGNILKNNKSSINEAETCNAISSFQRKKRKRKVITLKRVKKSANVSKAKINNMSHNDTKNITKRVSSVRMISLISQGTQATSADIRRSVRRVRRAASLRKTVPPVYASKGSYSSKISAKVSTKRPLNRVSRTESYDKATSTSDPLLEDDAVQVLHLTSCSLLSFTMVSCGISDLIIEQCPKLIHIEVQACRILKQLKFKNCPLIKRLNVSQCPKLNICALATSVMSLSSETFFLVSYEPCMQGYHPGEGEKAIFSKASLNESVLLLHDICDLSYDGIQAKFKEKMLEWIQYLFQMKLHTSLLQKKVREKKTVFQFLDYPYSHDLRKIHGHYSYSSSSGFCDTEGRYQVLTNNPVFCEIFETNQLDCGFPVFSDCIADQNPSLIPYEVMEKYLQMQEKFVAFYIPVTENNQIRF